MEIKRALRAGLYWVPIVALLIVLPFHFRGTSNGHDLTFHVNSWIEVARQWHAGIVYPHWAALANFGNGEPRFVFYPPISWTAGALLGLFLPWHAVPGTLAVIVSIAAGISMWLFAREWLDEQAAVIAATLYAVNPYLLVVVYERGAFAELIAAIWIPGILLFALRERGSFAQNAMLLGIHIAAVWLTNLPAAVIASYLLGIVAIARAAQKRAFEPLSRAGLAMLLGLTLAGFYLLPAIYEQRWVQIGQAVSQGATPRDNFLFAHTGDAEHDAVLLRTSLLAVAELIACVFLAAWAKPLERRSRWLYNVLLGMVILTAFLLLPLSSPVWKYAPKLMYVQFPWRWLLVLNVSLVMFGAVAFTRRRAAKAALFFLVPLVIGICYWRFQQTIYPEDRPAALAAAIASGEGYEGTDEYTPTQADTSKLQPYSPRVAIQVATEKEEQRNVSPNYLAKATFQEWSATKKRFTVDSRIATRDTLRLLDYPAWSVQVDGRAFPRTADEETGRMVLDLPAGHHEVAIDYRWTPDRTWGLLVSGLGLLLIISLKLTARRTRDAEPQSL